MGISDLIHGFWSEKTMDDFIMEFGNLLFLLCPKFVT